MFVETLSPAKIDLIRLKIEQREQDLQDILPFLRDVMAQNHISYLKMVDKPKNIKKYVNKIYPVELPAPLRAKLPKEVVYGVRIPNALPVYQNSNTTEFFLFKGVISKPGSQQSNLFSSNLASWTNFNFFWIVKHKLEIRRATIDVW